MSEAIQAAFAQTLRKGASTGSDQPLGNSANAEHRVAIHRNNVRAGLVRALSIKYPAAARIVGEAFFAATAQAFIQAHPPRSPVLSAYGEDLADFVARFEPASSVPYLADVLRLEAARSRAYHAADAAPLDPRALAAIQPDRFAAIRLRLHPSASVIRSAYPVVALWAMNHGRAVAAPNITWKAEDALVTRLESSILVHELPPGGAVLIDRLRWGATLAGAVEAASSDTPTFDLTDTLACALQTGAFTAIES